MTRKFTGFFILACTLAGLVPLSCKPGGVGDPCTPEDEYDTTFSGFDVKEVNVENKSFQCETRVCLVNHFQGRVSCPYGQPDPSLPPVAGMSNTDKCYVPGHDAKSPDVATNTITTLVNPQLLSRRADSVVYCSCRCDGPDKNARYCKCPSGYSCTKLVDELGLPGRSQLAGSYCIKEGTEFTPPAPSDHCDDTTGAGNCD
ncbi:MAG TPA: hypothetical protein VGI10_10210 [Polyangiaceae bacterium]|jgi:hypothetical protein